MKVYVIKNEQGQYQTPDMSFISSIWQADLFNDYEVAKCYCERDCEIIECELMQVTELADYTKQVRKEVVQEIRNLIKDNSFLANEMLTGERLEVLSKYKMLDILIRVEDQLQGEDK